MKKQYSYVIKLVFIWTISLLSLIMIFSTVLPFVTSYRETSHVFFGFLVICSIGIFANWISAKSFNSKMRRGISLNVTDKTVLNYFPDIDENKIKNNDRINSQRLRILYAYLFFSFFTIINLLLALIFAFI